MLWNQSKYT